MARKTARLGRQTPTQALVLPYDETKGGEAVELYEQGGRTAMDWQKVLLYDMMAVDDDGLWVHSKFGLSVPRRNGKSEVDKMRELWGLFHGEHILHTAHRTTTSHSAWERLCEELDRAKVEYASIRARGSESITLASGGKIEFRTRSSKGGLGEGFDLLIIDEAQEYGDDEESALKYVVSDSPNPQTIFTGTPPTVNGRAGRMQNSNHPPRSRNSERSSARLTTGTKSSSERRRITSGFPGGGETSSPRSPEYAALPLSFRATPRRSQCPEKPSS